MNYLLNIIKDVLKEYFLYEHWVTIRGSTIKAIVLAFLAMLCVYIHYAYIEPWTLSSLGINILCILLVWAACYQWLVAPLINQSSNKGE